MEVKSIIQGSKTITDSENYVSDMEKLNLRPGL